ncbi:hypothetical protein ABFY48_11780 [Lysinibacillus pakistanensis]|uniref:hypothetical protein n=1 Tax=Lysinibacillus pakistanensis TaxID=759811 RepID=UPI003D2CE7E3
MKIKIATVDEIEQIEILYQELFLEMSILQPNYWKPAKQDVEFIKNTINEKGSDNPNSRDKYSGSRLSTCSRNNYSSIFMSSST